MAGMVVGASVVEVTAGSRTATFNSASAIVTGGPATNSGPGFDPWQAPARMRMAATALATREGRAGVQDVGFGGRWVANFYGLGWHIHVSQFAARLAPIANLDNPFAPIPDDTPTLKPLAVIAKLGDEPVRLDRHP